MKQIKVSEATPIQLDWLVAKCEHRFWRKEVVDFVMRSAEKGCLTAKKALELDYEVRGAE